MGSFLSGRNGLRAPLHYEHGPRYAVSEQKKSLVVEPFQRQNPYHQDQADFDSA